LESTTDLFKQFKQFSSGDLFGYLYGRKFKVRSDHGALSWFLNFKNLEGQLARSFEVLAS
jgi:hypothetical protein